MKTIALFAAVLLLSACAKSPVRSAAATPAPPAPPAAPMPVPVVQPAPAPPAPPRTDVLSVRFKEINEKGYPIVVIKNITGKDIDDISGGFKLTDADGNYLHATGQTIAVPGELFLAAGEEMDFTPYGLSTKTEPMRLLRTEPENLTFVFETREVTFMGETTND